MTVDTPELTLVIALAIGLLVGLERGWHGRREAEGARVAGVRTFGLIGLLGGLSALLAGHLHIAVVAVGFAAVAAALTAGYVFAARRSGDVSITSLVAGLVTYVLGAAAVLGFPAEAGAAAVVTTILLGYKPELHHWLEIIEQRELRAALQLLLISVVVLPILPDRGFGPWQALNPYEIWWMVVLIASISFAGYFAIRIAGPGRGIAFTGLFGGLASSTALTLHLSRLGRSKPELTPVVTTGILLACGTMFPRVVVVASLVERRLFLPLLAPAAAMAAVIYGVALVQGRRALRDSDGAGAAFGTPLELRAAIGFGILLVAVMLLGEALKRWLGTAGLMGLAAASGIADVDAIALSLARMARGDLALSTASLGIVVAAIVNTVFKVGLVLGVGGRRIAMQVGAPLLLGSVAAAAAVLLVPPPG
jgi:uncharacterized membrane protein (DUF4010 family)